MTPADLTDARAALHAQIHTALRTWPLDGAAEGFDALALALFRYQARAIDGYARLLAARGISVASVQRWQDIPLVPVSAFKIQPFCTEVARDHPQLVFETSGTSDGQPGRVHLADASLYDAALHAAFAHWVVPDRPPHSLRCLSLVPTATARPHSSLGYMVRQLMARWDDGGGSWHLGTGGDADALDVAGFTDACARAARDGVPVLLLATTIALELLRERLPHGWHVQLPAGSRLMDTGGPKGRSLQVTRAEQHRAIAAQLGLHPAYIVGELGMTELCSQRYETTLRTHGLAQRGLPPSDCTAERERYAAPPWLRSRLLAAGQAGDLGVVGHLDLANLDTLAFVQTADLGRLDPDGRLQLAGRLARSDWRGCGLDAEEITGKTGR